jgi:hypothetical protein
VSVLRPGLVQDAGVPVLHHYRVTKYDPALRDERGAYTGDDWTMFDQIGETFSGVRLTLSTYLDLEARPPRGNGRVPRRERNVRRRGRGR